MRWLLLLLLAWLPMTSVSAKVFCYYLVNQNGDVRSYREPPWDLSYPPKPMSAEDEQKKALMGHLVIGLVDGGCQDTGKKFDELTLADLQEKEEVYTEPEPPTQTESEEIPLDLPPPKPKAEDKASDSTGVAQNDTPSEAVEDAPVTVANAEIKVFDEHNGSIIASGLGANKAASLSDNGTVNVWNLSTKDQVRTFSGANFNTMLVHDEKIILGLNSTGDNVQIWDLNKGNQEKAFSGHEAKIMDLAAEGQYVASASLDNTVRLWNLNTGDEVRKAAISTGDNPADNRGLQAVAMNLKNKHLAAASDKTIYVWNSNDAKLKTNWATSSKVNALAISGDTLISASDDSGEIVMWDIKTGNVSRLLTGHLKPVRDFAISGDYLLSASEDGTIKVWLISRGELVSTLAEHSGMVLSLAVYEDSLASGSKDKSLRVWQHYLQEQVLQDAAKQAEEKAAETPPASAEDLAEQAKALVASGGSATPEVPSPTGEPLLALGESHSCAVQAGELWCWGSNQNAQLGNGNTKSSGTPLKLSSLQAVSAVASHADTSCAVHNQGKLSCWGWELIQSRQDYNPEPINIPPGVSRVAVGAKHTCALLQNGQVWCWGGNYNGQLGDGGTEDQAEPVRVKDIDNASQIALGAFHSCAIVGSGNVVCWGKNFSGQLGNGESGSDKIRVTTPVQVKNLNTAKTLTAGADHTCALLQDSSIECWGRNEFGQLGNGNSGVDSLSAVPVKVKNMSEAAMVAAGHSHTCAALKNAETRCWGNNRFGQIGNGTEGNDNSPSMPVAVANGGEAKTIAAGKSHTCMMRQNDEVVCWGQNNKNQLTQAASPIQTTPVVIKFDAGPVVPELPEATATESSTVTEAEATTSESSMLDEAVAPPEQTAEDIAREAVAAVQEANQKEQAKQQTTQLFVSAWEVDKAQSLEASKILDVYLKRDENPAAQSAWERWKNTIEGLSAALQLEITDKNVVYIRPGKENAVYPYQIQEHGDGTMTVTTRQGEETITIAISLEGGQWMRFRASSTPKLNDIWWKKK